MGTLSTRIRIPCAAVPAIPRLKMARGWGGTTTRVLDLGVDGGLLQGPLDAGGLPLVDPHVAGEVQGAEESGAQGDDHAADRGHPQARGEQVGVQLLAEQGAEHDGFSAMPLLRATGTVAAPRRLQSERLPAKEGGCRDSVKQGGGPGAFPRGPFYPHRFRASPISRVVLPSLMSPCPWRGCSGRRCRQTISGHTARLPIYLPCREDFFSAPQDWVRVTVEPTSAGSSSKSTKYSAYRSAFRTLGLRV